MTTKEIAYQMEDLQIKLWKLDGLAMAVNIAIAEGATAANAYEGALCLLTDMTYEAKETAMKIQEEIFKNLKSEEKEVV